MPTFTYIVDDEPQSTNEHTLSAHQILQNAGIDPSTHYLLEIEGQHQKSYQGSPDTIIHIHQQMKFISVFNGPTPVS
jgi:hypothetical protein